MSIPDRGPEVLGVNITFIITAFLAYSLRCFVRVKLVKCFGFDDCLMGLALLFFLLYIIASNLGVRYGTGRHHHDLSDQDVERARHCWWFCYLFFSWAMIFAKLSIGFLLLRISVKRIHTWILYAAMLISVVVGGAFFFVTVFQCHPVSYFWARTKQSGSCVTNDLIVGLSFTYSIFSIISDFTFAIIPGFLVWHLQLNRRAKLALIPLITMGCIASAAVIARMPYLRYFNSPDFLWATTDIAIWSTIEQGLAITAGSLATLRPLFFLALRRLGLSTQATGQLQSHGGKSGPLATGPNPNSQKPSKNSHTDMYKLSAVVETRRSSLDSGLRPIDFPKSPHFSSNTFTQQIPKKDTKKTMSDNESERSLGLKSSRSSNDEDPMHIMVSKSFHITDEERSLASRNSRPYR